MWPAFLPMSAVFAVVAAFRPGIAIASATSSTAVASVAATTNVKVDALTQLRATSIPPLSSTTARVRNWTNAACAAVPVLSSSAVATTHCLAHAIVKATWQTNVVFAMVPASPKERAIARATSKTSAVCAVVTDRLA